MKHFKSPNNEIYAYELDGSQDHLIPSNFISITDEEAASILQAQAEVRHQQWLATQPTKEEKIASLQAQLDDLKGT
jgi:hypothetical protein